MYKIVLLGLLFSCVNCQQGALGDNYYLMQGDRVEDRALVYCTESDQMGCFIGINLVPNSFQFDSEGRYQEYVTKVVKNENNYLIVETLFIPADTVRYWVVKKLRVKSKSEDSLVDKAVLGPMGKSKVKKHLE